MTITEFLEARIAEDEAVATEAAKDHGTSHWIVSSEENVIPDPADGNAYVAVGPWDGGVGESAYHVARHDPARVLAECAAKRAIVAQVDEATQLDVQVDDEFRVSTRDLTEEPYLGDVPPAHPRHAVRRPPGL